MKIGDRGLLEAETFEEHMHPGVTWVEPAEFGDEFERLSRSSARYERGKRKTDPLEARD